VVVELLIHLSAFPGKEGFALIRFASSKL